MEGERLTSDVIMQRFATPVFKSKKGVCREEDFYIDLEDMNDFFNHYLYMPCTDKQIKFFKSVINGNFKFVKHALNSGPIRNDHETMRAAINLACKFGQSRILEILLDKVNEDFFRERNLNFVVVLIAGNSEARRLEKNQEVTEVLDILIKNARKPSIFDGKKTLRWLRGIPGKIDFGWTNFGKLDMTPFMALCGTKNKCMNYVVKKILDADVVNIHEVFKETPLHIGVSALSLALYGGEKEVVKIILDKMHWIPLGFINEYSLNHVQLLLGYYLNVFNNREEYIETVLPLPLTMGEERMDIIQLLIEKCFRVTQENKIGHNNDLFMEEYDAILFIYGHDHFDAMMCEVIEEERRAAYLNDKITWYDIETVTSPEKYLGMSFHGDQEERFLRARYDHEEYTEKILEKKLEEIETKEKQICWGCDGDFGGKLLMCKKCRKARYCDALCQEEDWKKHQNWCKNETREEKESRRTKKEQEKLKKTKEKEMQDMFIVEKPGYSY